MIKVTKLDGTDYYINPHQIECIEIRPDTALVMLSGRTHIVRNEADDVLERIDAYRRRLSLDTGGGPLVIQE
jgi:flagellar protein FlbD